MNKRDTTTKTIRLDAKQIQARICNLRDESLQIQLQVQKLRYSNLAIEADIAELQGLCPHSLKENLTVQDCAETKQRSFCSYCGKEV